MDAYKTPESDLIVKERLPFKPVKAILYGLLISVVLSIFVSSIMLVIFAMAVDVDFTNERALNVLYSNNIFFMLADIIVSAGVFYYSGATVAKYTVGKEIKFSNVVSLLTFSFAVISFLLTDSFSEYPVWYLTISFASIPLGIYYGAKSKIQIKKTRLNE